MPRYDFRCRNCRAEWEEDLKIADRDLPVNETCVKCEEKGFVERYLPSAPVWGREVKKTPAAFKDLMNNIKKNHRHSTIDTGRVK